MEWINCRDMGGTWFRLVVDSTGRIAHREEQPGPVAMPGTQSIRVIAGGRHKALPNILDAEGLWVVPGAIDAHVHSRDPGYLHKETWTTLGQAAAAGGVVGVADMPNTLPPTLDRESLRCKQERAAQAPITARFFLGVLPDNLSVLAELLRDPELPVCGIKVYYGESTGGLTFSDLPALASALPTGHQAVCVFHSEDGCVMHHNAERFPAPESGRPASDHSRIRDEQAAVAATEKILAWAQTVSHPVHLAHVSTPAEVALAERLRAKRAGVTLEVAPHHLMFSTLDYACPQGRRPALGALLKVNPPVRDLATVERLRACMAAGEIDIFATDHAPHTLQEKQLPYAQNPSGLPALEFFYPLLFACADVCTLPRVRALRMATETPARVFGFDGLGKLSPGYWASAAFLAEETWTVTTSDVRAKCAWSPYVGMEFPVRVCATVHRGELLSAKGGA